MRKKIVLYSGIIVITVILMNNIVFAQSAYTQSGGTATKTNETYTSTTADKSAVKVTNSGTLTMTNCTVTKSGNTSSSDNSSFYGLNAGILAYNAKITVTGGTVNTTGTGANGIFAYGTSSSLTISEVTVKCTAQYAHAIMTSGGGTINVTNMNLNTSGANSAPVATDRGGGTIIVAGGTAISSGKDSPGLYSTGTVNVSDATVTATGSEAAVVEGKNNFVLSNVKLTSGSNNYGGALIMQSMSGDASVGTSNFTMTGGTFTVPVGAIFFVTNNSAVIKLTNVSLNVTSGTLLTACGTSRWGTTGSNGGLVTFTADTQILKGNILVDSVGTFAGTLQNSTTLTGAINATDKAKTATLTMDGTSKWILTSHSYLTSITNSAGISGTTVTNITGNGFNVYYNSGASANSYLGAKTYTLVNGGYLLPKGTTDIENMSSLPTGWNLDQNYPNPFNPYYSYQFSSSGKRSSNFASL